MKAEKLLAEVSRKFFADHHIHQYRTKKVSKMNDDEVNRFCHWFCEENNIIDDFKKYRNDIESQYRYCCYLQEFIDDGLCTDLQMIANGYIKRSALPNYDIENDAVLKHCEECKYIIKL